MSTSKIYKSCNGSVVQSPTITLTEADCVGASYWTDVQGAYGTITVSYEQSLGGFTISASTACASALTINYSYHIWEQLNGSIIYDETYLDTVILPAGQTSLFVEVECLLVTRYRDYNDGRMDEDRYLYKDTFQVLDQAIVPVCQSQPSGCTLTITGTTITAPTQRGLTNGSIFVGVTGNTESYGNYYLNGALQATGSTSGYTFSNLKAGNYTVLVSNVLSCFDQEINLIVPEGEFRTGDFVINGITDLVAANNPIILNVNTAITNPNAVAHKISLTVGATIANNLSILFNLVSPFEYSQTFYAKHFPNKTNYFLASTLTNSVGQAVGTNSNVEIATSLAQVLQNDSVISKVYYIEAVSNVVFLTAKELGSRFNLTASNVIITGSNLTLDVITTGQDKYDGQLTDNYSIFTEVMCDNGTNQYPELGSNLSYNKIAELMMPFSQTNQHKFNLNEVVKAQVTTPFPNKNVDFTVLPQPMRSFYCKFGEIYPLVANTNTVKKRHKQDSGYFWAINSCLDREALNDMTEYVGDSITIDAAPAKENVKFLTKSPSTLYVTRDSEQYLYFILEKNYPYDINVEASIYYTDGSSDLNQMVMSATTLNGNAGGVAFINVSYANLNLAAFETGGKEIYWYILTLTQTNCNLVKQFFSESKYYYLNSYSYPDMVGVNFQNSLGMYDTFDFIGAKEESINRDVTTFTKSLTYNNGGGVEAGFKSKSVYENKVTKKVTVNSGWIDKIHFDWLIELFNSKNIYCYTEKYNNYLLIADFTYVKNSNEDLYNITVVFEKTIWENSISI